MMWLGRTSIIATQADRDTRNVTNPVERHINVVATTVPATSDEVIVGLTKVWPECSVLVPMNGKIQNSATNAVD